MNQQHFKDCSTQSELQVQFSKKNVDVSIYRSCSVHELHIYKYIVDRVFLSYSIYRSCSRLNKYLRKPAWNEDFPVHIILAIHVLLVVLCFFMFWFNSFLFN